MCITGRACIKLQGKKEREEMESEIGKTVEGGKWCGRKKRKKKREKGGRRWTEGKE